VNASDLISSSIISLHPNDDGERAIELMEELRVNHLPVVRNNFYLGIISENDVLNWDNSSEIIQEHLEELNAPSVNESQHLFDIIEELEKFSLSTIPVLNKQKQYLGSITNRKLLYTIAKSTAIKSKGSVIVLQMKQNDYSMSEISRIVESNNAKILSSYMTSIPTMQNIEITLKLNIINVLPIIKDFERFDYTVIASYKRDKNNDDDLLDRYESLMRFLNP
tara:strand:+ start:1964 stop:2629 length:666 start_codon:yes stop_codon:yes gene_type:complete